MNIHYISQDVLNEHLSALPFSSPVVILSESGARRWGLYSFLVDRQNAGEILWMSHPEPNPTQNALYQARNIMRDYPADGIVAIGGGSVIDLAKAISAFHLMPGIDSADSLAQAIMSKTYLCNSDHALPIIAVPTTAGTGSEVTQWATIWNAGKAAKHSVDAPWLKPKQVWIVPRLIATLPTKLMLAAGLDAVCHASEAYWAKASNPLSRELSIRALQIMTGNLKTGLANPGDEKTLENLCTGSLMAGLAFSITRTAACHSISYPLTGMFGMNHGFAAAITLEQVALGNQEALDISELSAVFSPFGGIQSWIDGVCEGIVLLRLRTFGIDRKDIDKIAASSFTAGRMDNNPVNFSVQSVKEILNRVY